MSSVYHQVVRSNQNIWEWERRTDNPFNELIVSWNAKRPDLGYYTIFVSTFLEAWTPWYPYAQWGKSEQRSFSPHSLGYPIMFDKDIIRLTETKAKQFRVRVVSSGGGSLKVFHAIHVCASDTTKESDISKPPQGEFVHLNVANVSQMALKHPQAKSLCSPTSIEAVVRFLCKNNSPDPLTFAKGAWDQGAQIFGNWPLNISQAYTLLEKPWQCWAERLSGFKPVLESLYKKIPVVVSVRGPLLGSALPYDHGHLMVVTGYDPKKNEVLCMDPAFPEDNQTETHYAYADFMAAWQRRGCLAYIFDYSKIY